MHPLLDGDDKFLDLLRAALEFELHAAIGEVADVARDLELLRDLQRGVTETYALDATGEENDFVMHVSHSEGAQDSGGRSGGSIRKNDAWIGVEFYLHFRSARAEFCDNRMSNFNSDGSPESEWDDRGDVAWNEFDWERYLREQDEAVHRYLRFYEASKGAADRVDAVAEKMGWGMDDDETDGDETDSEGDEVDPTDFLGDEEVYTLHKNPIFIATRAIGLSLSRSWEAASADGTKVPPPLALAFMTSLHRHDEQAVQAIHALDFGDYAMAVSLFKRALSALNGSLALLNAESTTRHPAVRAWREEGLTRLFDLREIWLRVMAECRDELNRPVDDES